LVQHRLVVVRLALAPVVRDANPHRAIGEPFDRVGPRGHVLGTALVVGQNELDGLALGFVAGFVLARVAVAAARNRDDRQDRAGQGPETHIDMMIDPSHFGLLWWVSRPYVRAEPTSPGRSPDRAGAPPRLCIRVV